MNNVLNLYRQPKLSTIDKTLVNTAIKNLFMCIDDIKRDYFKAINEMIIEKEKYKKIFPELFAEDVWEYANIFYNIKLTHTQNYRKMIKYLKEKNNEKTNETIR